MQFLTPKVLVQILILTLGIYLILTFLRTTRGSGLVRGLGVTLLVGGAGLWVVSRNLGLDELEHILQGILGFVFVILAIIFQPELRRAIVSLGDNRLLGRFLRTHRREVVAEVAQAVVAMAKKKQGALIAFERKVPLDAYIDGAVKVDAEVNRFLLDSIFFHGNALHDGAVIIRGDRIEAAASLFPLTENIEISKSTGTRHRAALGLTEETDAVTVAVSEETGLISICKNGKMERRIARAELEDVLRDRVGYEQEGGENGEEREDGFGEWIKRACTAHLGQKLGAFAMGSMLFWTAYSAVREYEIYDVQVVSTHQSDDTATPTFGQLRIVLPDPSFHLAAPTDGSSFEVEVHGTRAQLDALSLGIGGVIVLGEADQGADRELGTDEIQWGAGTFMDGLEVTWNKSAPRLEVETFDAHRFSLTEANITVDTKSLDSRYQVVEVSFDPPTVEVRGPAGPMRALRDEPEGLELEAIALTDPSNRRDPIRLSAAMEQREFTLEGEVFVEIAVGPRGGSLGSIEREITLQCFDAESMDQLDRWETPSKKVRLNVFQAGILADDEPDSSASIEDRAAILEFIREHVRVFIDVGKVAKTEGSTGIVEIGGLTQPSRGEIIELWRRVLPQKSERFESAAADGRAKLWVEIAAPDDEPILLTEIQTAESELDGDDEESGEGE